MADSTLAKQEELFAGKHLRQLLPFLGDGSILAPSTSQELRELFHTVPTQRLLGFLEECLWEPFPQSEFALQDLVNEMGARLGLLVTNGRYKGKSGANGMDGRWQTPDGHSIIIEVKTSDVYRVNLDTLAGYRTQLLSEESLRGEQVSILLVVGRRDTDGLEAQIRGSQFAWNMRLISVDSLVKLLHIKENCNDRATLYQIYELLKPLEYTRVDALVDTVFFTMQDGELEEPGEGDSPPTEAPAGSLAQRCIHLVEEYRQQPLLKTGRILYNTPDGQCGVLIKAVGPAPTGGRERYWFAYYAHQRENLSEYVQAYVAFGCGSPQQLFLIPAEDVSRWLPQTPTGQRAGRPYWSLFIVRESTGGFFLRLPGAQSIDLEPYRIEN